MVDDLGDTVKIDVVRFWNMILHMVNHLGDSMKPVM